MLIGYAVLLGITLRADWVGWQYNNPDGGNGDGFNPVFAPGSYQPPQHLPLLLPPNAHLALAEQAAIDGHIPEARQHALTALANNPASGEAALMLFDLYARPASYKIDPIPEEETAAEEVNPDEAADTTTADNNPVSEAETEAETETSADEFQPLPAAEQQQANQLADLSYKLRPTHIITLGILTDYWTAQQQLARALPLWSDLLVNYPPAANEAFPLFHRLLNNPEQTTVFANYIANPPTWWSSFFDYLIKNETDANKIQKIYLMRENSPHPPSPTERAAYMQHLISKQQWELAYAVWANALPAETTRRDSLFDGGFEDTEHLKQLFSWQLGTPAPTVRIQQSSTTGVSGKRALHITFRKGAKASIQFQHVSQLRMLPSGKYQLSGRYRLNQLTTPKGLRWRIHCYQQQPTTLLAESELFSGHTADWREFQMNVNIPANCPVQMLRLESDSSYAHHNTFVGEVWFDDLRLKSQQMSQP